MAPVFKTAALLAIVSLTGAAAPLGVDDLEVLRAIDLRLATIAHRLVTANVTLCRDPSPATGAVIQAITQYDAATAPAARAAFGFPVPIAIEAVVRDSPAARVGLAANDGVETIGGVPLVAAATPPSGADRDAALEAIARQPATVRFGIVRGGERRTIDVAAMPGCRAQFEVLLGPKMTAESDGRVVQIGVRFFERYRDEETAVIVAHELAHIILRHRARLETAGVSQGVFAELGRNGRLIRRTEEEADRLGVTLLYNAGYDPAAAAAFWRAHGGDIDGGFFRSRTHASSGARATMLAGVAAAIPAGAKRPVIPALLDQRDVALDQ